MAAAKPDEPVALVLQGGGALGAYQAGAYEALSEGGFEPQWAAGISIGAINAAIIAGNRAKDRVAKLRAFWERVTSGVPGGPLFPGEWMRAAFSQASAAYAAGFGAPGFFEPRVPPPLAGIDDDPETASYYDTGPLRATLEELVDFDYLADGGPRLSVGAVDVATGNFAYFDGKSTRLRAEHVMASAALPPGFPAVEIDGAHYWDGGLVSNTPLQYVLEYDVPRRDWLVFQVDVFPARGAVPRNMDDVGRREKDIRYSSRTRMNTDVFKELQTLRRAARRLTAKLPKDLRDDPDAKLLAERGCDAAVTIVQLIHAREAFEGAAKDYEFSRLTMEEHWKAGRDDALRTLRHPKFTGRGKPAQGVATLDLARAP
ncbi:MAG: DUF3734 domain-containing protein, partial [Hyphomicrobiales bacterium]|nr:DUF3734 domain-containing protein [Hyphomicrobiales bacterium]